MLRVLRTACRSAVLIGVFAPRILLAQVTADTTRRDTTRVAPPLATTTQAPDSLKPPVSPGKAFLNSFFVPGLGQSRLDRQVPGAIFVGLEITSIVMLAKTYNDLRIAKYKPDFLRKISDASGGRFLELSSLSALARDIPWFDRQHADELRFHFWRLPAFYVALVLMFSIEWLMRRRKGYA